MQLHILFPAKSLIFMNSKQLSRKEEQFMKYQRQDRNPQKKLPLSKGQLLGTESFYQQGTSVTSTCKKIPRKKARIIKGFSRWFIRNMERSLSRIPQAWKSWETPRTVKA